MAKEKFQISLRENGEHSFKKSLESYEEYEKTKDQMLLKDTIMFLHQSVELLMKEMLVSHSPYLIFDELKDIPKKQMEANRLGTGIFFINKPPRSVTYEVAIDRVEAFLSPPELDNNLKQNLDRLNRLRNQLEHYAISADQDEVVQVLEAIHKPILNLFEKYLGSMNQLHSSSVERTLKTINTLFAEAEAFHHDVYSLVKMFNGQKVPGNLLGIDEEVILPKFGFVNESYHAFLDTDGTVGHHSLVDIFAESRNSATDGASIHWMVETRYHLPTNQVLFHIGNDEELKKTLAWVVIFDEIPLLLREEAKEMNIMVTGRQEYIELKNLVTSAKV